jgi:dipeptidyl aminopeptidase/acylaminoacyl peptidase
VGSFPGLSGCETAFPHLPSQLFEYSRFDHQFSKGGDHLYLTADDHARVKIFVISVPPTPRQVAAEGDQPVHYATPLELTSSHASSAIQPLSGGRLLFTQSSLTSPNQVFILRGLDHLERDLKKQESVVYRGQAEQITRFTEDALKGKDLVEGEDFWFQSAENVVHGWTLKPKGWKAGERKKWPVLLLIHGGKFSIPLRRTCVDRMYFSP